MNVRKFLHTFRTLDDLVAAGSVPDAAADVLRTAITGGRNIIVSGATHAGKTTMLSAMIAASPAEHRVVTVEETFELAVDLSDVVALQARQPSLEGGGEADAAPPGEGSAAHATRSPRRRRGAGRRGLDLLLALNTGVPAAATVHANSADDALRKLSALPLLAGRNIDVGFVQDALAASVDLVVHCELLPSGRRRIAEIASPTGAVVDGVILTRSVYRSAA